MDFSLSPEHTMVQNMVRDFAGFRLHCAGADLRGTRSRRDVPARGDVGAEDGHWEDSAVPVTPVAK
jgi:hypothetical protein